MLSFLGYRNAINNYNIYKWNLFKLRNIKNPLNINTQNTCTPIKPITFYVNQDLPQNTLKTKLNIFHKKKKKEKKKKQEEEQVKQTS